MSKVVSSKYGAPEALTLLSASIFFWYLSHRTNISRKVHALRRVSMSGEPNKFRNCHLDKINMTKHHNTNCFCNINTSYNWCFEGNPQHHPTFHHGGEDLLPSNTLAPTITLESHPEHPNTSRLYTPCTQYPISCC